MLANIFTFILLVMSAIAAPVDTVEERADCADVAVFYARGTTEAKPIGGVIGQTFKSTLATALGSKTLSFEGVDYPANVIGFLSGGDAKGSTTLANSVISAAKRCPNTKIVMSGYSQGAQLVHNAADKLSTAVQEHVSAVVVFGDPKSKSPLPATLEARRKTFCNDGDLICTGSIVITSAHSTYAEDAPAAATFVKARV